MKLLLDTHAFVWWDSNPEQLSNTALNLLADSTNELLLSVASIWEIQVKRQLGKLSLQSSLSEILTAQQTTNALSILPINVEHVLTLDQLPAIHKDPFDRILIAQAIYEDAVLVSTDSVFASYPVQTIW
ncbi:type II toxin-antitoxin system VapC family toxin [Oscillatoria sp. FACHB-1407]|uniref:type II toxin-antitoxin system VapC family toxin n=1 Tax=Oscillatoria sp. FACHB-1407 TaxID=2692847 RepID=UPI001688814D|nr:PIN domain-containing protein [Oscillatoria sp. FACHB-1407]MBD2460667.1 type II toxin-antitoxin system VapC family toxin [Oscillatoria sp. FACHB-1407]